MSTRNKIINLIGDDLITDFTQAIKVNEVRSNKYIMFVICDKMGQAQYYNTIRRYIIE